MSHTSLLEVKAQHAVLLFRGNPNMNSLIGLGAATSFTAGTASILLPGAGLEIGFLEEPVMLLAFVLLGRALETRARLKASGISCVVCSSLLSAADCHCCNFCQHDIHSEPVTCSKA